LPIELQRLLEAVQGTELDVTKSFWFALKLVFYNSHTGHATTGEEVLYVAFSGVKREVAEMGGVWRLRGERKLFALSISAVCRAR